MLYLFKFDHWRSSEENVFYPSNAERAINTREFGYVYMRVSEYVYYGKQQYEPNQIYVYASYYLSDSSDFSLNWL